MFAKLIEWIRSIWANLMTGKARNNLGAELAVSDKMSKQIDLWCAMYRNEPPWLDEYICSMNLPASIASEMARLVTLEMKSEITGSSRADYLNNQYQGVIDGIRQYVEYGVAKGGLIIKPYVVDKRIVIDYVQADCFFPAAFDSSGRLMAAVFVDQIKRGSVYYTRFEYHNLDGNVYTVKNTAYRSDNPSYIGTQISLDMVTEWAGIESEVPINNIDRPLFGYFKMPIANTTDDKSPLGVSVYSRAVDLIKQADKQYSRMLWEFESGERAIYADDSAFKKKDNKPVLPHKRLYRTLAGSGQPTKLFEDYTPELRDASILNGLNAIIRKIEFNCGLAYGTLSDVQDVDKTAEEIKASKQRSYSTVSDTQKSLRNALEDLVYAMDTLCTLYNLAPAGKYDVSFEFDDSIIVDSQTEQMVRMQEATAGFVKKEQYLMWRYGVSEEQAREMMPESPPYEGEE